MPTKTLQSLERGIDLLFLFSTEKPILSLEDISRGLDLPESTAYRLAATLCKKSVLVRSPAGKGYALHASLLRLLVVVRAHIDIGSLTLPSLEELARVSGETSQLCLLQGTRWYARRRSAARTRFGSCRRRGGAFPSTHLR